jgi:serine phosphatase RsbU (regulator of sigma subunit)
MFVTVWLGVLDLETGKLSACNAGHEYPILRLPGGEFELYKDPHGFVLGGLDGVRYKEYELQLKPGAKLFLYTDGLPEATNAAGELFGTERSLRALNAAADRDAQSILKHVRREVDHFVGAAPQFDDMTMMCVEYYGKEEVRQA